MSNLDVQPGWPAVRQLETHELARGGVNGNLNEQAKALLARTEFLKNQSVTKEELLAVSGGTYAFSTLTKANQVLSSLPEYSKIEIQNDGENNGVYSLEAGVLKRSEFDPVSNQINLLSELNGLINTKSKPKNNSFYYINNGILVSDQNEALFSLEIDVIEGEYLAINTKSFSVANAYYIVDAQNNVLSTMFPEETIDKAILIKTPANAKKVYVNCMYTYAKSFSVSKINNAVFELLNVHSDRQHKNFYYQDGSKIIKSVNNGFFSLSLNVSSGERYLIDTRSFGTAAEYYIVDGENNYLQKFDAVPSSTETHLILIPENASKLYVNCAYTYADKFKLEKIPNNLMQMFSTGNKRQYNIFYYSQDNQHLIRDYNTGLFSVQLDVESGQNYLIDTKGFGVAGEHYITDSSGNILAFNAANDHVYGEKLIQIPENASKLYVNCDYSYAEHFHVERVAKKVAEMINPLGTKTLNGVFFSLNGQTIQQNSHPDFFASILTVKTGQNIDIQTKTYGTAPNYCLVDENEVVLDFKPSSADVQNYTLTVPNAAVKLYVNCEFESSELLKIELSKSIQPIKDVRSYFPNISYPGKLREACPNFYQKFKEKKQDVVVVLTGTSLTQGNLYVSDREDATTRPAALHTHDLASSIFDVLIKHWDGQKYRRYDHADLLFSSSNWTVVNQLPDYIWDDYAHIKNGLTKTTTDANASVSMTIPANAWQFNFVYRSDSQCGNCTVSIAEGNGKVELYNGSEWIEANGATFSMYEPPATETKGNTQYQKRLKMRCRNKATGGISSIGSTKQITISKSDNSNRFNVVGFEWSPREYMLFVINGARGGFEWGDPNGNRLDKYQDTDIWAFNPDLLLAEITIINWGASEPSSLSKDPLHFVNIAKRAYFNEFDDMPTSLHSKSEAYSKCDVVFYSDTLAASSAVAGAWDSATHEPKFGAVTDAATNGSTVDTSNVGRVKTNFENYEAVESYIASKDYLFIPVLSAFKEVSEKFYGSYWNGMQASSKSGNTLTIDGVHFNDNGAKLFASLICPIFEYI